MPMFLLSVESEDIGLLGNVSIKAPSLISDREVLVQNWGNRVKSGFLRGGPNLKVFAILFFFEFVLVM